ncbi:hypothetical protein QJQ45_023628 [Haematococcus lacustris]|nr:hypothetical protein QJQ45_023628 [Haematococcus lacustris]
MPVMPSQDSLSPAASLIAFCRLPVPGQVKTRLAYSIGADAACEWYSACAQYTVALCSSLPHLASLVVYHSCKDESEDMQQWLGAVGLGSPRVAAQRKGGDLGDKMLAALQQEAQRHPKVGLVPRTHRAAAAAAAAAAGLSFQQPGMTVEQEVVALVIIVGSDVPGLSVAVLEAAVRALDEHEVVLGPAVDGGYYLLGLTRVVPQLFQDIAWSTDTVLDATVKTVHSVGLRLAPLHSLPVLRDVDHLADLRDWVAGLPPPNASPRRADIQNNLVDRLAWARPLRLGQLLQVRPAQPGRALSQLLHVASPALLGMSCVEARLLELAPLTSTSAPSRVLGQGPG